MGEQEGAGLLIEEAKNITPVIRKYAAEAERQCHLSREVVDAMLEAGLYGMTRPPGRSKGWRQILLPCFAWLKK